MSSALNQTDLHQALQALPEWSGDTHGIHRSFRFQDFPQAISFMSGLVELIEAKQHHPEWTNIYNRVDVTLRTHDADNRVTAKDIELAQLLNQHAEPKA